MSKEKLETSCFTYKVEMIVQILAEDEPKALDKLNKDGGYVSNRTVKLLDSIALTNE
jgi:glycerol kinase